MIRGMKKILVTDSLFIMHEHVAQIEAAGYEVVRLDKPAASEAELVEAVKGKAGYILGGIERVTRPVIDAGTELKAIVFTGIDYETFIPAWEYAKSKGIVIANTSLDPGINFGFVAAPQSGTVQFWFYGTAGFSFKPTSFGSATGPSTVIPTVTTTNSVPAGSYAAFVIAPAGNATAAPTIAAMTAADPNLKAIAGNFTGYVIAQSQFQYCHGVASISAPGLSPQTYLGLVMDKSSGGGGNGTLSVSGTELPRTNQAFADQLDN